MAASKLYFKVLCVVYLCLIFVGPLSAQVNNCLPSDSAVDGQGSLLFFYKNFEYLRDCSEVRSSCLSPVSSGVYLIKPDGYNKPFEAYCDNDIDSGGWTVVLRHLDGFVDFKRNWSDYKGGFGFLSAAFWLGNDKLSYLTNQAQYELRIDMALYNGTSCDVRYNAFRTSDEWSDYTITSVGEYQSDIACKWEEGGEIRPTDISTSFTDCNDVYSAGNRQDGIYSIRPQEWNGSPFNVFCNMSIDGGKWTVIQRRVNGSTDFYRDWISYKEGFGDIQHEFWLGNEKIYYLTNQDTYEYRVDFVYWHSSSSYYKYSSFRIGNETNKYKVTNVGSRNGTSGNSLYHTRNIEFSTYDNDNDGQSYNCAEGHRSGWWHGGGWFHAYSSSYCYNFQSGSTYVICSFANLNGDYNGGNGENIFDYQFFSYNQIYTEIKIRRIS